MTGHARLIRYRSTSIAILILALPLVAALLVVPEFARMFHDLGADRLPLTTGWLVSTPQLIVLLFLATWGAALLLKDRVVRLRRAALAINTVSIALSGVTVVVASFALVLPLLKIIKTLGAGG